MVKNIPYSIPSRFRLAFVIIAALAYIGNTIPYVALLVQNHTMYDSVTNITVLIGSTAAPLIVALIASALTQRRGIGRWWGAAWAGFVIAVMEQIFMSIGGYLAPMNYEPINIGSIIIAAGITLSGVWYERSTTVGRVRNWPVFGVASLYGVTIVIALIDTLQFTANGQNLTSGLLPLGLTLGVFVLSVGMALYIYRQLPLVERMKRVLIALTAAILVTMVVGGVMTLLLLNQISWANQDWLGIVTPIVVYVGVVWWLLPLKRVAVRLRMARTPRQA